MEGDERRRFCFTCSKSVFDLSAMTEDEAEAFLAVHLDDDPDARVRLYRRPDGRVLTTDCPVGAKRRHQARAALAVTGGALAMAGVAALAGNLRVPHAPSSARATHARFEPPRPIPNDPIRGVVAPLPQPWVVPPDEVGQGWGAPDARDHLAPGPTRRRSRLLSVRPGAVAVSPGFPAQVVIRIVLHNHGRLRLCYERGLERDAALAGEITTSFTIARDGSVSTVTHEPAATGLRDHAVVACVMNALARLEFPKPEQGVVAVRFPILFGAND